VRKFYFLNKEKKWQGAFWLPQILFFSLNGNIKPHTFLWHNKLVNDGCEHPSQCIYARKKAFEFFPFWLFGSNLKIVAICSQLHSIKEKIALLSYELKKVNQFLSTSKNAFLQHLPSVKEQVENWIIEEIRFLEKGTLPIEYANSLSEHDNKIHTSLSVAKLAVIIRLLVVDKIIINRTIAPMLRIVGKTFSTLQKDDISVGSLETKYHAPDKALLMP
jgi:hypothetical protein